MAHKHNLVKRDAMRFFDVGVVDLVVHLLNALVPFFSRHLGIQCLVGSKCEKKIASEDGK
jgi:hypothetical protein